MASSKLVTTNPDLPRDSSSSSSSSSLSSSSSNSLSTLLLHLPDSDLHHHLIPTSTTFSMDDLLNSIYPSTTTPPPLSSSDAATPPPPPPPSATKTVDDVWKEIVAGTATGTHSHPQGGSDGAGEGLEAMTLEDFLTKAGAVREEDVRGGVLPPTTPSSTTTTTIAAAQFAMPVEGSSSVEAFGNGVDGNVVGGVAAPASASASAALGSAGGGGGKGKRRAVEEPVDKATLQKQRRMIKNRESAARSRERKQAYTTELEYLVQQLEQENALLLSEEAEKQQQRYKQLMECLIPIEERREPKRRLRRTNSVQSM